MSNADTLDRNVEDSISRKAAIDALGERPLVWSDDDQYVLGERNQYDRDKLVIETLPSAQPNLQPTCNQLATDCISRQAAINAVYESSIGRQMIKGHKDLITILKALPSAQPERKRGEWISDEDGNIYCSVCGRTGVGESFCEHCGANMKGEEE